MIAGHPGPEFVEYLDRHSFGIGRRLYESRCHASDKHSLRDTLGTVPTDVARHFPATGRMTNHRDVPEIHSLDHRGEVIGISIHVVPGRRLAGPAMATTIVSDDAEAMLREKQHLAVPGVGAQRPSMRERDHRTVAPVFVIDRRAVLHCDHAHVRLS